MLALVVAWLVEPDPAWAGAGEGARRGPDNPYHIVMVLWRGPTDVERGFEDYLRENGVPYRLTVRNLGTDPGKAPAVVAEIKALRPDLVFTWGTSATLGVVGTYDAVDPSRHITDIPVIFTMVAYPTGARIAPTQHSSGRNVTGTTFLAPIATQMNAIASYRPFDRLGIIFNPKEENSLINVNELRGMARERGFTLIERPVPMNEAGKPDPSHLPELVRQVKEAGAQFLYVGPDSFTAVNDDLLTRTAIERRLPIFAATERPLVNARAMMGLVSSYYPLGKLTGYMAERVLVDGVPPSRLEITTLTRFSLILRMKVALDLKFYPPLSVLKYAKVIDDGEDQVINTLTHGQAK
ncbi:MAG: ABC transporter substrate-binding protein [Alphaproteobacteria bacterium]